MSSATFQASDAEKNPTEGGFDYDYDDFDDYEDDHDEDDDDDGQSPAEGARALNSHSLDKFIQIMMITLPGSVVIATSL